MSGEEVCYVCDASKVNACFYNENLSFPSNHNEICDSIISQLSLSELKSVLFLLLDSFGSNTPVSSLASKCIYIMRSEEAQLISCVKKLCFGPKIRLKLIELLGTVQNFKLMKELRCCKHMFYKSQNSFGAIRSIWKLLYSVSKDLDDAELEHLNRIFFPGMENPSCCEELFLQLLCRQRISESNLSELADALKRINRHELSEKIVAHANVPQDTTKLPAYHIPIPTADKPCGLAVIVNEENFEGHPCNNMEMKLKDRKGSSCDRDNLQSLWQNFGFAVEVYNNFTAEEIKSLFVNISKRPMLNYYAFVACILSHGDKEIVYGTDLQSVKISDLIDLVANECISFLHMPKVFLIQACQGQKEQPGFSSSCISKDATAVEANESIIPISPVYSDVYLAVATIPGYVSYRSPESGSLFVSEFVKMFSLYGDEEDIEQTMRRVTTSVSENEYCCQMPVKSNTLKRSLIFKKMVQQKSAFPVKQDKNF